MSVSAIGNTYSYIYNYETKKLTTTDGTANEFTKYFNGEIEGYESETLNGFDRQRKAGFENMLSLLEQGAFGKEKPAEDAVLELSGKNIDADTIEFSVNGKTYLRCSVAPALTYSEYLECSRIKNSGKTYACTNNDGWSYPDEVYNRVLKRYEDRLNQPLSEVFDADAYRESLRSGNHSAIRESDSSDNGRAIGVTTVGNIGYVARYADSSTPDNPVIKIGDYEVVVNEVDPHNATQLEMFALLSYLDDTNQTNNTGMSSFSKLRSYADLAEANGFCEGIQDVNSFFDKTQNWEEIIRAIKEVFLGNSQTYEQALDCDMLINIMSGDKESGFIAEFGNYEEFHKAWMSQGADTPFSYTENMGFNEAENSISLVQGMAARLNNGFVLSITDSMVYPEGDFRDNTAAKESVAIASALSHLIKVANGQIPINMFYSRNQDNNAYAKIGLQAFGIDTSRPFTINETTFHFDSEGQIRLGSGTDGKAIDAPNENTGEVPEKFANMSFADLMNSGYGRNTIPTVNQIVSSRNTLDGEIYLAYFSDDRITCNYADGRKAWEIEINDEKQLQKVNEYFDNYAPDENWVNAEYYSGNDMGMAVQKSFWLDLFNN